MTAGIVGLGLIGGSLAKAYHEAGERVLAHDIDRDVLSFAVISGAVDEALTDETMAECDVILLAVRPAAAVEWLKNHAAKIDKHTVVIDCCGTKRKVCAACFPIAEQYGITYLGGHPMAGTQFSGFKYAKANLFVGAPMVLVPPRIAEHRILDDLGAAAAVLLLGQRFERVGIADHDAGLIEAARLILARGQVDGGLAADGRIDRGQQRRRDLGKAHAALIRRRGKARKVAHHAAAERNDHVAAAEAVLAEEVQHIGVGREVLAPLARGEDKGVHTVTRLFKRLDRALAVERVDRVVRHDGGHAGGADLPEKLARAVE